MDEVEFHAPPRESKSKRWLSFHPFSGLLFQTANALLAFVTQLATRLLSSFQNATTLLAFVTLLASRLLSSF